jgi:Uma2 family endonuclease
MQTLSKPLNLEEFLELPETKPALEYTDGEIVQKPTPQGKHSLIQGELVTALNALGKSQKIALALPELRCTFGGRSLVPDVVVLRYQRIPRDDNGDIANVVNTYPDWTIEILSPEQNMMRVTNNILHCLNYGCSLGWLIDPQSRAILVFIPQKQPQFLEDEKEIIPSPDFFGDCQLTVGDIFSWLNF